MARVKKKKKRKIQNVLKEKKTKHPLDLHFRPPESYLFGSVQEASN